MSGAAVRGVLFDLDGVLADTEPLHWAAYREVLLELGVDVGIEEYRRRFISRGGGPEYACEAYRLPLSADELRARKLPRYLALLRRGVRPRPGARAALERLRGPFRTAVATNSVRALRHAGNNPVNKPVKAVTASVKSNTRRSIATSSNRGTPAGASESSAVNPYRASANPAIPPNTASNRLSVSH